MNDIGLYYNPATKIIFASRDAQDGSIEAITADQVPDLIANGATVDSSADSLVPSGNAAGGASSVDQSASTGSAAVATDTAGEQGNVLPVDSSAGVSGTTQAETSSGTDLGNGAPAVVGPDASASNSATATDAAVPLGTGGVVVPVADHTDADDAQLDAAAKVNAQVEDQSGNVVAGGAPAVVTTSPSTVSLPSADPDSDEHPIKQKSRWLRNKLEAGEAVVLAQILALLHDIEHEL